MRPEKQLLLDDIKDRIAASNAVVVTSYKKLEPNAVAEFRTQLAKTGGSLAVVKKRVLLKAAHASGLAMQKESLEGHIAIIFLSEDPFATTKSIYQFSNENDKVLEILGGRFE